MDVNNRIRLTNPGSLSCLIQGMSSLLIEEIIIEFGIAHTLLVLLLSISTSIVEM